ncbi:MAG TPA: hypothetical protein VMB50_20455 [Myxococcales bacterium]|nr:hypothetical protein [Myxococcales bacterium]
MPPWIRDVLWAAAAVRGALGLAPFLAAGLLVRRLGFPPEHDNASARLMARLFGVRDALLGVLAAWVIGHPADLPFIALVQAGADGGDLLSAAIPLARRQGIDRAAAMTAAFAGVGFAVWLAVWAAVH